MYAKNHLKICTTVIRPYGALNASCCSVLIALCGLLNAAQAEITGRDADNEKRVIGPIAVVEETESDLTFPARVDTGATTSSIHVEEAKVVDEASKMTENVGKKIRFRIKNHRGESEWLERKIAEISVIKTSEREERRYKVPVTLNCEDVKKRVLVSLNDRSHMTYPVLLGRNFLQGDFVVDVDLKKQLGDKNDMPNDSRSHDALAAKKKGEAQAEKD